MEKFLITSGLVIEILGLCFLFYDLLRTKTGESYEESFQSMQNESDAETRRLIIGLHSGLSKHSEFVAGYLSLEYGSLISDLRNPESDDVSLTEKVRILSLEGFKKAQNSLVSEDKLEEALSKIEATRVVTMAHHLKQLKLNLHLRKVAIIGIVLVGIGALTQLSVIIFGSSA